MTHSKPVRFALATLLTTGLITAQVSWTTLGALGAPEPLCGYAWDAGRSRLVAFGGALGSAQVSTMREWDGSSWSIVNPPTRPSARTRPAMAYDEARGVTVLFGGGSTFSTGSETWTYDGTTWTQLSPPTSPSLRFGAAMAYDRARQVVVLFGGFVPSGQDSSETWEWNGTTWNQRTPVGSVPGARGAHRMVYDEARAEVVMVGGYSTPLLNTLGDTWRWNGTNWSPTTAVAGPGSICDQAMVYDPTRQRVVLAGGLRILGPTPTDLTAVWEWDGTTWTQRTPSTPLIGRNGSANAFDTTSNRLVLGGGSNAFGIMFTESLAYGPVNPATVTTYGNACITSAGPLDLEPRSLPYIGLPFEQALVGAQPTAVVGLLIYGGSNTSWNGLPLPFALLPIGAPGCELLASVDLLLTVPLIGGQGSATWNLPNMPSAIGAQFFTQGAALDPGSPLPFQIDMSSARQFAIGSP